MNSTKQKNDMPPKQHTSACTQPSPCPDGTAAVVYIATSLDGYIADKEGGLGWLDEVPAPAGEDFGFAAFMQQVDALLMGRKTFETVCQFDGPWPYTVPVFVLSRTLQVLPETPPKVTLLNETPAQALERLRAQGLCHVYIDGGKLIQSCLQADLIDEMRLFTLPVLLGGGTPLFGSLERALPFTHVRTTVHLNTMVESHYTRTRIPCARTNDKL